MLNIWWPTKKASQLPSKPWSTRASMISQNRPDMVLRSINSQKRRSLLHCISKIYSNLFLKIEFSVVQFNNQNSFTFSFQAAQLIKWTLQLLMNYQNFWLNIKEINMETWMSKRLLAKKKNHQRTPVLRPQKLAQSDK